MLLVYALAILLTLASLAQGARMGRKRHAASLVVSGHKVLDFRPDATEFIILFNKGTSKATISRMCQGRCRIEGHPDEGGVAFATVGSKQDMDAVVAEGPENVEILEVDPIDSMIPEIKLDELGTLPESRSVASWGLERAGVPSRVRTGKGVHIYVQDTGIRVSHSDFGSRAISALDVSSGSAVACLGSPTCAEDKQGHGTHCAGTAGGTSFGVASEATLHAVKTLGDDGSGARSWQITGLDWVVANAEKPAVISMSLGGTGKDLAYVRAIDAASGKGITVVVAAGNSDGNSCVFSPAFVPSAITVGATDSNDDRAYYSNWGTCNDIMAPGSGIISASIDGDKKAVASTGTSMACPHVSGGAALLLEEDPTRDSTKILALMKERGRYNFVAGLKWGDPNLFLWVGGDPAPISPPTPAPPATEPPPECPLFAVSREPDEHGDCSCRRNMYCSLEAPKRNCPTSVGPGGWGGSYFSPSCTECRCFFDW